MCRSHTNEMRAAMLCLGLLAATAVQASAQGIRGFLRVGADFGGDAVVQFQYDDGTTPDVKAGGGLSALAGLAIPLLQSSGQALEGQLAAGLKYRTIPPVSNQTAKWLRVPVEGLLFYRMPSGLRLGGGVAIHAANVLEAEGAALDSRVEFTPKPGAVLQAEYLWQRFSIDLRYTIMSYEVDGVDATVNANSFGAGVSFLFGN